MLDGWERAEKAVQGTAQVAGTLAVGLKITGINPRLNKPTLANPGDRATLHLLAREQGYEYAGTTKGGYVRYKHPDGKEMFIRPNGEVGFLGSKIIGANGKKYHPRTDAYGKPIETHSTGIFVESLDKLKNLVK